MNEIDDSQAPLLDHLIELRRRLFICFAALLVTFLISYAFAEQIFGVLVQPLARAGEHKIIFTQIFEGFFVRVKVAFFAACMLSFPIIANQLWQFVAPGLYRKEKRALLPFLFATPVLFTMGACLAYFAAIPMALHFLLGFQGNFGGVTQEAMPAVGSYLDFTMQFMMAFGIAFLLPILMMLIERAGIVTLKQYRSVRRYAIVGAVGISAVLTPPDVGSQFMLAVPLVLLYEIGMIGIWLTSRRKPAPEEVEGGEAAEA